MNSDPPKSSSIPFFRRRLILKLIFLFIAIFFIIVVCFKDEIAFYWIQRSFVKALPKSVLSLKKLSIWPEVISIEGVEIKGKSALYKGLAVHKGRVLVRFSLLRLPMDSFMAVKSAQLFIQSLEFGEFSLDDVALGVAKHPGKDYLDSRLVIRSFKIKEAAGKNLAARFMIAGDSIVSDNINCSLLGGDLIGSGRLDFRKGHWVLNYKIHLENIQLSNLMKAFSIEKRVDAKGVFKGDISIVLKNGLLKALKGELTSVGPGQVNISDSSFLDKSIFAGQDMNIVIENFKNYHYDIGSVKIDNSGQNINIDISLEGAQGSRSLQVVWHGSQIK